MSDQELLNLKKSIESAKRKQSEVEGKKKSLLETLDKKFGYTTLQQAQKELSKMKIKITDLEKVKQKKVEELEQNYDF